MNDQRTAMLLDKEKEGWLALAVNEGEPFASHVASILLDGCNVGYGTKLNREVCYYILLSAMARGDKEAVRKFVADWSNRSTRPTKMVSKWMPGDHYYAMNDKFDTLEEAIKHLQRQGYSYGGLLEQHIYSTDSE